MIALSVRITMKSFTKLIALTAAAMAGIPSMAAPSPAGAPETKELKDLPFSDSLEFQESQCDTAVEFDLSAGSLDKRQSLGPPNYWCCDVSSPSPHGQER